MNEKLKHYGRKSVKGLLKMDKMQLIYWLLKANERDHWLLNSKDAQRHAPGINLESAQALRDMLDDAGVDTDSAHHNFTRLCDKSYWVCIKCGLFTDREETQTSSMHEKGCNGVCDYKVTACDFFDDLAQP
jgi:hypothetical protein